MFFILGRHFYLFDVLIPSFFFARDLYAGINGLERLLAEHEPFVISHAGAGAEESGGGDNESGRQGMHLRLHRSFLSDFRVNPGLIDANLSALLRGRCTARLDALPDQLLL